MSERNPHGIRIFPLGILGVYLLVSPVWYPPLAPRMYDNARLLEIMTLVAMVASSMVVAQIRHGLAACWASLHPGAKGCIAIFLAGGVAGTMFSPAPHMGMQHVSLMALLAWLFLFVCLEVRHFSRQAEAVLAASIFAGATLVGIKFWTTYLLSLGAGPGFSWISPFLDFANVRFFGQYQAYALLLVLLPIALLELKGAWRVVVYLVAANFWAMQWMVGSRAVWVGFAAALVATTMVLPRKRVAWAGSQLIPVLAGGVIFGMFTWFIQASPQATPIPATNSIVARSGESDSERIAIAKAAVRLVAEHPLAGVGPGQFGLRYSQTPAAHAHNSPLQLLVEYGVPAGGAAIALGAMLLAYGLRQARQRSLQQFDPVSASLCAALVMGLVDALFSGNLVMPHSQVYLCVVAGWLLGRQKPAPFIPYAAPERQRQRVLAVAGIAVLAAIVTAVLALEYISLIREMPYPPKLRIPNFWQYGRFTAW